MLSELQSKKLTALFNRMDADASGTVTEADFRLIVDKLATSRKLNPKSLHYAYLRSIVLSIWEKLSLADGNGDGSVTQEEWLKYYETLINSATYEKVLKLQVDVFLGVLDENDDGEISCQEYVDLVSAYGVEQSWATENFERLDLNGDGHISQQELFRLMDEFFRSDRPEATGNSFWGSY